MIIVGDIGNTETKVCLIDKSNMIIKKIIIKTKDIIYFSREGDHRERNS